MSSRLSFELSAENTSFSRVKNFFIA